MTGKTKEVNMIFLKPGSSTQTYPLQRRRDKGEEMNHGGEREGGGGPL